VLQARKEKAEPAFIDLRQLGHLLFKDPQLSVPASQQGRLFEIHRIYCIRYTLSE
jgi:hypothetical protein